MYLHDKKEEKDDEDADFWMEPNSGATESRFQGRVPDFCPGVVIKQGVNSLSRHQLHKEQGKISSLVKYITSNGPVSHKATNVVEWITERGTYLTSHKLAEAWWKCDGGNNERHHARVNQPAKTNTQHRCYKGALKLDSESCYM